MLFFLHINVKMSTIVGISTFMSRKTFMLELSMKKKFYNLEARLWLVLVAFSGYLHLIFLQSHRINHMDISKTS